MSHTILDTSKIFFKRVIARRPNKAVATCRRVKKLTILQKVSYRPEIMICHIQNKLFKSLIYELISKVFQDFLNIHFQSEQGKG